MLIYGDCNELTPIIHLLYCKYCLFRYHLHRLKLQYNHVNCHREKISIMDIYNVDLYNNDYVMKNPNSILQYVLH